MWTGTRPSSSRRRRCAAGSGCRSWSARAIVTVPTSVGAARYAGSRVHRVEDARLLTGAGTFVDDITRPGLLHACFVRSPHPRARILSVDASAALALPGVHAVFTADDLNGDVVEAWYT